MTETVVLAQSRNFIAVKGKNDSRANMEVKMGKRVSCAYVRKYTADKIEDDRRKGKLDPEAARYGREAYRRYKKREAGK